MEPDLASLCVVFLPLPIPLATFNLMMSIFETLQRKLINLRQYGQYVIDYNMPFVVTYFKCLDMERPPPSNAATVPLERNDLGFDLVGRDITFRYPHQQDKSHKSDKPNAPSIAALNNLSFHFEAGKIHALVGDNGCGKTTLVQLISQLYTEYDGHLLVNGHDIKDYNINEIRSHISIMFQEVVKLNRFTVRENIGIGNHATLTDTTDPLIERTANDHGVTDFISLDTVIGDLFKRNKDPDEKWQAEISGGQWQKIALARTFLTSKEADLIILDEPTSALDVDAEFQFFQQLKKTRRDKTTIFITHKYVTTATADCIHFMARGKIVERGTHAELMAAKGEYARRYNLQTQGFAESAAEK